MPTQTGLNRGYSFLVAAFMAIWRHARNSGAELAEIPQMAAPVADDGSTKGVRTTIPLVNRRGRSGSAPYQADLAIEDPTH